MKVLSHVAPPGLKHEHLQLFYRDKTLEEKEGSSYGHKDQGFTSEGLMGEKRHNARVWDSEWSNLLLGADVLVLLGDAGHFTDADSILDVFKLQAQVLPGDGQHSPALPGARLWRQLVEDPIKEDTC